MSWFALWWRTAWFGPVLLAALAVGCAQHFAPAQLLSPQLRALEEADVPTATFVAVVIGVVGAHQVVEPAPLVWRLSPVRSRLRGAIRALLVVLAYLASSWVFAPHWGLTSANACLTAGVETLVLLLFVDRRVAWVLPALHAASAALLGRQVFGALSWWAWPADPTPEVRLVLMLALAYLAALASRALRT